jgi:lipoprotein-anchoring transpeptidase ErfK/SrfK
MLWPLMAGCASLSVSGDNVAPTPTPNRAAVATQVAAAVAATVSALTPGSTPGATSPDRPPSPVRGGPGPAPTGTPVDPGQPTATPTTPAPSSTSTHPIPTSTATPTRTPAPTPVILAPIRLAEAEVGGGKLFPRYWTNTHAIVFTLAAAPGTTAGLYPQVEVQPLGRLYTGKATAQGAAMPPNAPAAVTIQVATLAEGPYHWQARLSDGAGHNGPWADYYAGPAFRLDRTPPAAPVVSSSTDPDQRATYSNPMARLSWTKPADAGGIHGYLTGIDRNPRGLPSGPLSYVNTTVFGPLISGTLYFHVRAEDWAGNLGAVTTYVLHVDHRVPVLAHALFDRFQFNPQFDLLTMHFVPDKTVQVQVAIRRQTTKGVVRVLDAGQAAAGKQATVTWDGKNARGLPVQPGLYTMVITATDHLGNQGYGYYTDIGVNYKRIVVHLSTQNMEVFDGNTLLRTTLVTTGNQHLPTPLGIWHVGAKFHPYKFLSPWKKGSVYWYPTTTVSYALGFHTGGYFIHDATWRSVFGPGTNSAPGPPGSGIYAGSHGCIEVPLDVARWLYTWAQFGTVVDVVS